MGLREKIARAMCASLGWGEDVYTDCLPEADAVLAMLRDQGLVVVPVEPTEAMLDEAWDPDASGYETYKAMIAAAPKHGES